MHATSFKLGDQQFLVIPTFSNAHNGGSTESYIYRFAQGSLHKYQPLRSRHGYSSAIFEVAGNVYLAIGNYHYDSSTIYQLQGHRFVHFQHVSTIRYTTDIEHLHMDGHDYLVFACYHSSQSLLVFLWNNGNFELYETKQIRGFRDVEHFEIGGKHYLAAARYNSGSSGDHNVNSYIYKWTGAHFALFQTIPTKGALKFSFTRIGKMLFLAVANMLDSDKPLDQKFKTPSVVYKWNGKKFQDFRYLNTTAAASVSFVNMRHHSYLVVGSILANGISVYRAEGSGFHLYQRIPNVNATHTEFFQSNNRTYMFTAGGLFEHRYISSVYGWMES
ncbi:thrombospondin-type laminin G domain and EAR repeat-containing protein-like [Corticium candelabrum]|uniref:thrombospondin-type laminin G domain and EAR repeat-containing protein-like n=1 Tax=Corticium candelabrum TaxID=121492 RepID=UPI002E2739AA|nr:thrombospondin-type laminin G domain and EAR repeat-containing protein-like [Corticium candelabrum]